MQITVQFNLYLLGYRLHGYSLTSHLIMYAYIISRYATISGIPLIAFLGEQNGHMCINICRYDARLLEQNLEVIEQHPICHIPAAESRTTVHSRETSSPG